MKLRKGNAVIKVDDSTDAVKGSESSQTELEEAGISKQKRNVNNAAQPKGRAERGNFQEKTSLLELALQHVDIKKQFDRDTLISLRLTSNKIKKLVEDAGALTHFKFAGRFSKVFNAYLESPTSYQRVESMSLNGKVSIREGIKFMLKAPSKLKMLELNKTSDGTEAILFTTLPQLTSLTLSECLVKNEYCKTLAEVTWPLQELIFKSFVLPTDNLTSVLANFPDLRKVLLHDVSYSGEMIFEEPLETVLPKLELLEISYAKPMFVENMKERLFHGNLQLPSLHTLNYIMSNGAMVECLDQVIMRCSWLKQLRFLELRNSSYMAFTAETLKTLVSVLNGGPLESLSLQDSDKLNIAWNDVSLPNLISLDLGIKPQKSNLFGWISTASLPRLEVMEVHASGNWYPNTLSVSSEGIDKFTEAFPRLRCLKLLLHGTIVSPFSVRNILIELLPKLEEFGLNCLNAGDNDEGQEDDGSEDDIIDIFGTENEENSTSTAVKWPKLRKLSFNLCCRKKNSSYPVAVAEQLVSAAHHCPNLKYLSMTMHTEIDKVERLNNMAATLKQTNAWPLMKYLSGPLSSISSLRKLWPRAEFH